MEQMEPILAIKRYYEHYKSPFFLSLDNSLFKHTLACSFRSNALHISMRKTHKTGDYLLNQAAEGKF